VAIHHTGHTRVIVYTTTMMTPSPPEASTGPIIEDITMRISAQ